MIETQNANVMSYGYIVPDFYSTFTIKVAKGMNGDIIT